MKRRQKLLRDVAENIVKSLLPFASVYFRLCSPQNLLAEPPFKVAERLPEKTRRRELRYKQEESKHTRCLALNLFRRCMGPVH